MCIYEYIQLYIISQHSVIQGAARCVQFFYDAIKKGKFTIDGVGKTYEKSLSSSRLNALFSTK